MLVFSTMTSLSCGGSTPLPTAEPTTAPAPIAALVPKVESTHSPSATVMAAPAPAATATHTQVPTATPTSTPAPERLSVAQVFEKISPSVAYVETANSTGSGVLIDGGYVITNAHVVWPFRTVRVVFPNGTEFLDVPVKGLDTLSDLAVLGPIDAVVHEVDLVSGESLAIGTDLYLIGYPGEVETFPQPTISRGVLARLREWDSAGLTYFQTDAAISGGQSGGALVSDKGEVVGISGFTFGEAGFGLAVSSEDIRPIIGHVIAGRSPPDLVNRQVSSSRGNRRHVAETNNRYGQQAYVIRGPAGNSVQIEVLGESEAGFRIYDSFGEELLNVGGDHSIAGPESFRLGYDEPHILVAWQLSEDRAKLEVDSDHKLSVFTDPDDGRQLRLNQLTYGNIDFPSDFDYFLLPLRKGQVVDITVRSAMADPLIMIDFHGADILEIIADDDSGDGLFGTDSNVVYRAPHTGNFLIIVNDTLAVAPGGYTIEVNNAPANSTLTLTTLVSLLLDDGVDTQTGFGQSDLRAAFADLPDSFEEIDPLDLGVSISDLGFEEYGLDFLRGCVRSLVYILEWRHETQSIPQRPDRRTVEDARSATPGSQNRGKATYCRPAGGRQRHCVRSAQRLHVASHAA